MSKKRATVRSSSWMLVAVFIVLVLGGGAFYFYALRSPPPTTKDGAIAGTAQIAVIPATLDLGTIDYREGIVTTSFTVENQGNGDLIINEMETSCGCTAALLIVNGQEGPKFGMRGHGEWPKGWSARLKPGERAELKVTYDPNAHGIYVGAFDRLVLIRSNDSREPVKRVRIYGYQKGG